MTDIQQAYAMLDEKISAMVWDSGDCQVAAIFFLVGKGYEEKEAAAIIEKYYDEKYKYEKNIN